METEEEFEYSCSVCGTEVGKIDRICPSCGADLTEIYFGGTKIRGWLLFFCINLTIIAPIVFGAQMIFLVNVLQQSTASAPENAAVILLELFLYAALTIYGIICGISLWQIKPDAVRFAKIYLGAFLSISLLQTLIAIVNKEETGSDLLRAFLFVGTWYSYLTNSVRVRNTYG